MIFRLVPLIQQAPGDFVQENSFEVHALFVFHGATPKGSSAEALNFDPATGAMRFKGEAFNYIGCGLLGLKPRNSELKIMENGAERTITYGDVITALSADIRAAPAGQAASAMPIYDLTQQGDLDALKKMVSDAWVAAGPVKPQAVVAAVGDEDEKDDDEIIPPTNLEIPENTDLLGIDPTVYRQINAALKSGKQHIMLYGPPGTGKTTLARWIAATLTGGKWTLVTGSSDWSSQDIIGGYQPVGNGGVALTCPPEVPSV